MRILARQVGLVTLILPILVAFSGCAPRKPDPLNQDNYRRIRANISTQDDVRAALGEPTEILGNQWHYEREDRHLNCFIDFDDKGRVTRTQWIDAMNDTNPWIDSNEAKPK